MLRNKQEPARPPIPSPKAGEARINKIAAGTVVVGDINADGDFRVEGKIIGNLVCSSRLVVSETGYIEGKVDARNITVEGEIRGNVITRELLQIDKTGKIYGDIYTQKLVVQVGATFTGGSFMNEDAKESLSKAPQKPKELLDSTSRRNTGGSTSGNGMNADAMKKQQQQQQPSKTNL